MKESFIGNMTLIDEFIFWPLIQFQVILIIPTLMLERYFFDFDQR